MRRDVESIYAVELLFEAPPEIPVDSLVAALKGACPGIDPRLAPRPPRLVPAPEEPRRRAYSSTAMNGYGPPTVSASRRAIEPTGPGLLRARHDEQRSSQRAKEYLRPSRDRALVTPLPDQIDPGRLAPGGQELHSDDTAGAGEQEARERLGSHIRHVLTSYSVERIRREGE